ncbi:MAG: division/cell wall cluster transcriptional repressor MraZ [Patescibacteria group bacterium]
MLIGEYTHTLDDKKRLSLPAKFRKELGKGAVMTRGLDHCLFVFSSASWKKITEKMSTLSMGVGDSRGFNRFLLSGAVEAEIDNSGRILIPDFLKKFAGLKTHVVFAGVGDRVEVWDESRWDTYKKHIELQGDAMAEKLGDIGAL